MILHTLKKQNLINCPDWLPSNTCYITLMGSQAYGTALESSDIDYYGWCIPPKHIVFPHTNGIILGFGNQGEKFEQWLNHDVKTNEQKYDFQIFSIIKYFQLLMENNPNVIDSIYTPRDCVIHSTAVSELVRERRDIFIHKGLWPKFKGYAMSQYHKIVDKKAEGKRKALIDKHGYDTKFASHLVRLLSEAEQLLLHGTMDLRANNEQIKAIKRGEYKLEDIENLFRQKEIQLERLYHEGSLQLKPDEQSIKKLLMECLESHYGNLSNCVSSPDIAKHALNEIISIAQKGLING